MEIDPAFAAIISQYRIIGTFIGSFFFGESVIITVFYLAGQLSWNLSLLFVAAFLGTVVSDALWVQGGKVVRSIVQYVGVSEKMYRRAEGTQKLIDRITSGKPFLVLLFIKFLYGSRIATILYLGAQRITLIKFLIFDSIGTIIWLVVIAGVGYLAGKGVGSVMPIFERFEVSIVAIVILIGVMKVSTIWITRRLKNE